MPSLIVDLPGPSFSLSLKCASIFPLHIIIIRDCHPFLLQMTHPSSIKQMLVEEKTSSLHGDDLPSFRHFRPRGEEARVNSHDDDDKTDHGEQEQKDAAAFLNPTAHTQVDSIR